MSAAVANATAVLEQLKSEIDKTEQEINERKRIFDTNQKEIANGRRNGITQQEMNRMTQENWVNKKFTTNKIIYLNDLKKQQKTLTKSLNELKKQQQLQLKKQQQPQLQENPKPTGFSFFSLFGRKAKIQEREPPTQNKLTNKKASAKVAAEPRADAKVAAPHRTDAKVAAPHRASAKVAAEPIADVRASVKVAAEPIADVLTDVLTSAKVAAQPRTSARTSVSQSNVSLKKTNLAEYLKFKFAIIYYIDLRFQYLHEFITNISTILDGYLTTENENFDNVVLINLKSIIKRIDNSRYIWGNTTIRDVYLGHLHSFVEVEGGYNFDDLTEQDIVDKINQQNAIIAEFLNYIATILKPEAMSLYEGWLSSKEYKGITSIVDKNLLQSGYTPEELNELNGLWIADDSPNIPVEYNGEDPSSTDKPIEEYKTAMEEYNSLNSLFKPKITQLGAGVSFSRFNGNTNKKILSQETPVSSNSRSNSNRSRNSRNSRSNSNSSNSSLGFDETDDIALLKFVEREVKEGIPYIYEYIQGDIMYLLIVLNKVLAYIDIMAIFFLNREPVILVEAFRNRKETVKKRQDRNVVVSIKKIIDDSEKYKEDLIKLCDTNTMFSMINSFQIYSSLYISIYGDKMRVYNRSGSTGGRKRAVGRPRKTPVKKPTVKASTKKPSKPTAKKPTKPAKPTTKKPTTKKPTAKKPTTKPVAKKPTKK
jgi:hypothetical protein